MSILNGLRQIKNASIKMVKEKLGAWLVFFAKNKNRRSMIHLKESKYHLNAAQVQYLISDAINQKKPFLVVRPGGVESEITSFFIKKRLIKNSKGYRMEDLVRGELNAGICPKDDRNFDKFSLAYLSVIADSDLLLFYPWTAELCLRGFAEHTFNARYHDFDPLTAFNNGAPHWLQTLEGQRVLIVCPFENSIKKQYARLREVQLVRDLWPICDLKVISPPVTFAGNSTATPWASELNSFLKKMDNIDYDVALVAAGAYGPSIASHAKRSGRIGIHVGARLQLYFGILGRRWEGSALLAPHKPLAGWCRPCETEIPSKATEIEGGCYW